VIYFDVTNFNIMGNKYSETELKIICDKKNFVWNIAFRKYPTKFYIWHQLFLLSLVKITKEKKKQNAPLFFNEWFHPFDAWDFLYENFHIIYIYIYIYINK